MTGFILPLSRKPSSRTIREIYVHFVHFMNVDYIRFFFVVSSTCFLSYRIFILFVKISSFLKYYSRYISILRYGGICYCETLHNCVNPLQMETPTCSLPSHYYTVTESNGIQSIEAFCLQTQCII
jgi:hypothetical protein